MKFPLDRLLWVTFAVGAVAEQYRYHLDIVDKLDRGWTTAEHSAVTRIECASLCFRDACPRFAHRRGSCYLLGSWVDEGACSEGSCQEPGMKIYKMRVPAEEPTTTGPPDETTTTILTTTAVGDETTTLGAATTTEAGDGATTPPSTTPERTMEATTTELATTEAATKEATRTEATTTEASTSTTEAGTTTSVETTTAISSTTTTEAGFRCPDPPLGGEAEVECPSENHLLMGLGSRSPFFGDVLGAHCTNMNKRVYSSEETVRAFFSLDGGITLSANCEENEVIYKFKVCVADGHIPAITLHCAAIEEPDSVEGVSNVTSDDSNHVLCKCGDSAGLKDIYFMDAGNGVKTRVVFTCLQLKAEDQGAPEVAPAAGGVG